MTNQASKPPSRLIIVERFIFYRVLAFAVCLLSACSSVPERVADTTAPAPATAWSTEVQTGKVSAHWLESFNDPRLNALVEESMRGNFDLQAAAARVQAAAAQVRIDGSGRWPQLSFLPGYQRSQVRNAGFGSTEFGAFQALFDLSWELDVWGRIAAFREAAVLEAEATTADFQAARLSLAAAIARNYFELAEAGLQVEVAEQSIADRRTIAELVHGRFERGLAHGLDLRLALTDLANAEEQLAQVRNRLQLVTRRLEVLLGRYPAGAAFKTADLPDPPAVMAAGLPSELLTRRPDLSAAFERLRAADQRLESAEKALLPRITLTASGGTRTPALTELIDPRAAVWNLALGLAQPLFTGDRLRGDISLKDARVAEALNSYKNTALNAFREVESALAAEEWLREREHALREAVEQTAASRKLAVYSYRHGFTDILTLLDSYRSTYNAQSAYFSVKRQLLNNRVDLYLALGGSF